MVAAAIRTLLMSVDYATVSVVWRQVADQLRERPPKLATLMGGAEADVISFMANPKLHWLKLHSTNPIERLIKEVKCRAYVPRVGLRPPEDRLWHLPQRGFDPAPRGCDPAGAERRVALQHRYMALETMVGRGDEPSTALLKAA